MKNDVEFDLFDTLRKINSKDGNHYSSLSDAAKKEYSPFMIQRWLTGTTDKRQILMLNTFVNPFVFEFQKHDAELLHRLFSAVSSGQNYRYSFPKQVKSGAGKSKMTIDIIAKEFNCCKRHAKEYMAIMSSEDIIAMAEDQGYQKKELTALKRELKNK